MSPLPDRGDGTLILVLVGQFDRGTLAPFRRAPTKAKAGPAIHTVIDVSGVVYADSSLLRLLVRAHQQLPQLTVAGPLPAKRFQIQSLKCRETAGPHLTAFTYRLR
ncbi:STAS domain-containing protein [Streptomyces sp. NPDC003952]